MNVSDVKFAKNGRYVRVLEFDKRGIGSSDRFTRPPTLEERIDDITAVMDAEGIERDRLYVRARPRAERPRPHDSRRAARRRGRGTRGR